MPGKILCVAEKPSIAKAVAGHLGGGRRHTGNRYVKNYDTQFDFGGTWGACSVTVTSVVGHTVDWDFEERYRKWSTCRPMELFDAPVVQFVKPDNKDIARNIQSEARSAKALYIWTDCDREGEYIGKEVRDIALQANSRLEVKRARFSNIERAHILQAARRPSALDERQAQAVAARIELDLRIGAAFTRWQTIELQTIPALKEEVISYGSCQFPTLGFVVDRFKRVKEFVPEQFWSIKITHKKEDKTVIFNWDKNRLFDRMAVTILFEKCLQAKHAIVTDVVTKPTKKWKPLPLTTVELQKNGSRFLHMTSEDVMKAAEKLYTAGWISYPRTETDQFDRGMDLPALCGKQTPSAQWGNFAQGLVDGGFQQPRAGRNNDQAHPPIHPVAFVAPEALENNQQRRVYEFVVRRFLACCSKDAEGQSTIVHISYGPETFHANGLIVLERNYLDVYPYDKWESTQELPRYQKNERFVPTEANMTDGKTSPPGFLTEPELIALMDANGIGTDATMAEHISKIKTRKYVFTRPRGRGAGGGDGEDGGAAPASRGRGRGRGRGGAGSGGRGGGGMEEFIPSNLGVALIEAYDLIGLDDSLGKPFLRKEMEDQMKAICEGRAHSLQVVQDNVHKYREMFIKSVRQVVLLKNTARGRLES